MAMAASVASMAMTIKISISVKPSQWFLRYLEIDPKIGAEAFLRDMGFTILQDQCLNGLCFQRLEPAAAACQS